MKGFRLDGKDFLWQEIISFGRKFVKCICIFVPKITKVVFADMNVDLAYFWRQNSNVFRLEVDVARFARNVVK